MGYGELRIDTQSRFVLRAGFRQVSFRDQSSGVRRARFRKSRAGLRLRTGTAIPQSSSDYWFTPSSSCGWDKLNVMFRSNSILIQAVGLAAAALCLEGSRTPTDGRPGKLEMPQTITATILRLEELLDEAESHHHVATVEKLIADDYRGITVGGGIIAKRDVLTAVGGAEEASSQSTDREVRVLENAAVYTALVLDRGRDSKTHEQYALATRVMDVWQKRGREWKLVNDQATGVTFDHVLQ